MHGANKDGCVTLTSRAREILAEAGRYKERGWLPATIRRKEVWGCDGDYLVGQKLLPHDGGAEITVPQNQFHLAAQWLTGRKWDMQPEFGEAWPESVRLCMLPSSSTRKGRCPRSTALPAVILGTKVSRAPSRDAPVKERRHNPAVTSRARS